MNLVTFVEAELIGIPDPKDGFLIYSKQIDHIPATMSCLASSSGVTASSLAGTSSPPPSVVAPPFPAS